MEILLQDLSTPVGKYFSYNQWEFPWVQPVPLPLSSCPWVPLRRAWL